MSETELKVIGIHHLSGEPEYPMRVYSLVTIGGDAGEFAIDRMRIVGLYHAKALAVGHITANTFDLYECGYYEYACVECLELDVLYPANGTEPVEWFKWDDDADGYKPCSCPEGYENVIGWGL